MPLIIVGLTHETRRQMQFLQAKPNTNAAVTTLLQTDTVNLKGAMPLLKRNKRLLELVSTRRRSRAAKKEQKGGFGLRGIAAPTAN